MSPTEKLVKTVARILFEQDEYQGYDAETKAHHWMMRQTTYRNKAAKVLSAIPYPSEEEIAELRKDAERYRWLRDDNAYAPEEAMIQGGEELDGFIDAQLEAMRVEMGWGG